MCLRKPSRSLVEKVKTFEGKRLKSYRCPAGVWTIGYGHTSGVTKDMVINDSAADAFLVQDLKGCIKSVERLCSDLSQSQMDALADFVFNLGIGSLKTSTLMKKIKKGLEEGDMIKYRDEIKKEFGRWNKATVNGKKVELAGLTKRRQWEAARFFDEA